MKLKCEIDYILELRWYKNDSTESRWRFVLKLARFSLCYAVREKGGNFKINIHLDSFELFLYCLCSNEIILITYKKTMYFRFCIKMSWRNDFCKDYITLHSGSEWNHFIQKTKKMQNSPYFENNDIFHIYIIWTIHINHLKSHMSEVIGSI